MSAISIWEIVRLQKRNRVELHQRAEQWLNKAIQGVNIIPIDAEIAAESVLLPDYPHKDPADRFIIATARVCNLHLMTHDQHILDYINAGYVSASSMI